MKCDGCDYAGEDVKSSLMFDLCPRCEAGLRTAHAIYAEARREWLGRQYKAHVNFLRTTGLCK